MLNNLIKLTQQLLAESKYTDEEIIDRYDSCLDVDVIRSNIQGHVESQAENMLRAWVLNEYSPNPNDFEEAMAKFSEVVQ